MRAETVFRGRVTNVTSDMPDRYSVQVTFLADTVWKGSVTRDIVVHTGASDGNCGYRFEQGKEYLVFASPLPAFPNTVWTGICSGTQPLFRTTYAPSFPIFPVEEYLMLLGPGTPVPGDVPLGLPNTGGGASPPGNAGDVVMVVAALVALGLAFRGRRRAKYK